MSNGNNSINSVKLNISTNQKEVNLEGFLRQLFVNKIQPYIIEKVDALDKDINLSIDVFEIDLAPIEVYDIANITTLEQDRIMTYFKQQFETKLDNFLLASSNIEVSNNSVVIIQRALLGGFILGSKLKEKSSYNLSKMMVNLSKKDSNLIHSFLVKNQSNKKLIHRFFQQFKSEEVGQFFNKINPNYTLVFKQLNTIFKAHKSYFKLSNSEWKQKFYKYLLVQKLSVSSKTENTIEHFMDTTFRVSIKALARLKTEEKLLSISNIKKKEQYFTKEIKSYDKLLVKVSNYYDKEKNRLKISKKEWIFSFQNFLLENNLKSENTNGFVQLFIKSFFATTNLEKSSISFKDTELSLVEDYSNIYTSPKDKIYWAQLFIETGSFPIGPIPASKKIVFSSLILYSKQRPFVIRQALATKKGGALWQLINLLSEEQMEQFIHSLSPNFLFEKKQIFSFLEVSKEEKLITFSSVKQLKKEFNKYVLQNLIFSKEIHFKPPIELFNNWVLEKKIKKAEYFDNKEWANILKKEFTGEILNALKLSSAEKKPSSQQLIYNTEVNFFEKIGQLNAVFFENILSHYILFNELPWWGEMQLVNYKGKQLELVQDLISQFKKQFNSQYNKFLKLIKNNNLLGEALIYKVSTPIFNFLLTDLISIKSTTQIKLFLDDLNAISVSLLDQKIYKKLALKNVFYRLINNDEKQSLETDFNLMLGAILSDSKIDFENKVSKISSLSLSSEYFSSEQLDKRLQFAIDINTEFEELEEFPANLVFYDQLFKDLLSYFKTGLLEGGLSLNKEIYIEFIDDILEDKKRKEIIINSLKQSKFPSHYFSISSSFSEDKLLKIEDESSTGSKQESKDILEEKTNEFQEEAGFEETVEATDKSTKTVISKQESKDILEEKTNEFQEEADFEETVETTDKSTKTVISKEESKEILEEKAQEEAGFEETVEITGKSTKTVISKQESKEILEDKAQEEDPNQVSKFNLPKEQLVFAAFELNDIEDLKKEDLKKEENLLQELSYFKNSVELNLAIFKYLIYNNDLPWWSPFKTIFEFQLQFIIAYKENRNSLFKELSIFFKEKKASKKIISFFNFKLNEPVGSQQLLSTTVEELNKFISRDTSQNIYSQLLNLKLLSYSDLTVKEQENIITDFLNYAITYASWEAPSGLKTFIEQIQILIKEITQIFKINIDFEGIINSKEQRPTKEDKSTNKIISKNLKELDQQFSKKVFSLQEIKHPVQEAIPELILWSFKEFSKFSEYNFLQDIILSLKSSFSSISESKSFQIQYNSQLIKFIYRLWVESGTYTTKEIIKEIFAKVELGKSINKEIGAQVEKQLETLKKANENKVSTITPIINEFSDILNEKYPKKASTYIEAITDLIAIQNKTTKKELATTTLGFLYYLSIETKKELKPLLLSLFRLNTLKNTSLYNVLLDLNKDEIIDGFEKEHEDLVIKIELNFFIKKLQMPELVTQSVLFVADIFKELDPKKWTTYFMLYIVKQHAKWRNTTLTIAFEEINEKITKDKQLSVLPKVKNLLSNFEKNEYFILEEDSYSNAIKERKALENISQIPETIVSDLIQKMMFNDQFLQGFKTFDKKRNQPTEKGNLVFSREQVLPEIKKGEQLYIYNAGLALIWPFVGTLFTKLGYIKDKQFIDKSNQFRAVHLLQYIIDGGDTSPEFVLVFNKLICGMPLSDPLDMFVTLTEEEKKEADQFLESIKNKWKEMKNTSLATFRDSFLKREGTLTFDEKNWKLKVESKPIDVLLRKLPWGFSLIKFHWIDYIIFVEWTTKN